jgi:hypothetical protein
MTRASIFAMTRQIFEDQAFTEVGMDRIIGQAKEAKMTGVQENTLSMLLNSKWAPIKTTTAYKNPADGSVIAPFILRPQRHRVNANGFVLESGNVHPTAGVGAIPASAWQFVVTNESSIFASPLASIEKYFLPGRYIAVLNKSSVTGIGRTLVYKILSAVNANAGGVEKALVSVEPNYSAAGWAALSAGDKAVYQATHGLLIPMANSVSDYESWCYQDPTPNTAKLLVYWLQTVRETHCYNDEYIKALMAPNTSNFFKKFRTMPLAEQRRQQSMAAELAFYNTVFFGQRINEFQVSDSTYRSLPQVVDPANTSCVLEYKANALGIEQQLADCGRVIDMAGQPLNLDLVKEALYSLKRHRSATSGSIETIDALTDRRTADNILTIMTRYYKDKYAWDVTRFYKPGEKLIFNGEVIVQYNEYEFSDEMVKLAVISNEFFDDHLGMFPLADKSRGRYLWLIDWSDVELGLAGTASANRQTNIYDNLYKCVIKPNIDHYLLNSKTFTVIIEDPNRHLLIRNFSDACPILTPHICLPYE